MKIALIATLVAVAATAATAQLASPSSPAPATAVPTVQAPPVAHHTSHQLLHADRERVKADKERLKLARQARDDGAVREAQATLRTDMDAWHADRERLRQ